MCLPNSPRPGEYIGESVCKLVIPVKICIGRVFARVKIQALDNDDIGVGQAAATQIAQMVTLMTGEGGADVVQDGASKLASGVCGLAPVLASEEPYGELHEWLCEEFVAEGTGGEEVCGSEGVVLKGVEETGANEGVEKGCFLVEGGNGGEVGGGEEGWEGREAVGVDVLSDLERVCEVGGFRGGGETEDGCGDGVGGEGELEEEC